MNTENFRIEKIGFDPINRKVVLWKWSYKGVSRTHREHVLSGLKKTPKLRHILYRLALDWSYARWPYIRYCEDLYLDPDDVESTIVYLRDAEAGDVLKKLVSSKNAVPRILEWDSKGYRKWST